MRRPFETRHLHQGRSRRRAAGAGRWALAALLGLAACKTPGPATPVSGGGSETAPDQRAQPDNADPDPQDEIASPADCTTSAPYLRGVVPRPTSCLGNDFVSRLMWQAFIALQWPADTTAGRGVALKADQVDEFGRNDVPLVWQTWKQDWELVAGARAQSSAWSSYEVPSPPCDYVEEAPKRRVRVTAKTWPEVFVRNGGTLLDKINLVRDDLEHDLSFTFTGPVIAADRSYVRYETRFNQALYDCARNGAGAGCTAEPLSMPGFSDTQDGAIAVKAAWRALADESEKGSYHWRRVLVPYYEQDARGARVAVCKPETHVLLAMHVIYKDSFIDTGDNQWVWATFEHEKLAPACGEVQAAWNARGFSYEPEELPRAPLPPPSERTPVELCRRKDVPAVTAGVNADYAGKLPAPWNGYRIAAMQWLLGGSPAPARGVANVILEAYAQDDSCMGCHNENARDVDFIWTLALDSYAQPPLDSHSDIGDPSQLWR
jgi:hypothetical protein